MTKSHTPGPWRIDCQQDEAPYIVAEQGKRWNNPTICHLYQDVTPEDSVTIGPWLEAFDNAAANARLIAAAPDMLDTLRKIETTLDSVFDGWIDSPIGKALYAARAAIAKATGEERIEA